MNNIEKATKIGVAYWCKVNNMVDEYTTNGVTKRTYQVHLELSPEDTKALKAEIKACFDEFKALPEVVSKKLDERFPASLGDYEKDGKTLFKFWTYSEYKATKDKPASTKNIPVLVLNKGILAPEKSIGNGSKVQVAFVMSPFAVSSKGFGVSLNLNKVLIHELIEFGGSSDDLSVFGVKDVFSDAMVTPTVDVSTEDVPF